MGNSCTVDSDSVAVANPMFKARMDGQSVSSLKASFVRQPNSWISFRPVTSFLVSVNSTTSN